MIQVKSFWQTLPKPFFVLAPMEQVTDVVFRHVIKKAGAPDLFFTEFANATGWVHAGDKGIGGRLVKTDDEHPIVAQIWGGEPGDLEQFAKHCASLGYDGIDINMGCPAKSAVKSGGSALIRQPQLAAEAIAAAKKAGLPVSVKTRLGYAYIYEWQEWLKHLLEQDITALTIHLRTKKEMSKVPAHWELIPEIKRLRDEIAPQTLLIINGDIKDREQGEQLAAEHGVDGIMIGRGVFTNPFCFSQLPLALLPASAKANIAALRACPATVPPESHASSSAGDGASESSERQPGVPLGNTSKSERYSERNAGQREGGRETLVGLLRYHLDLYDQYAGQTKRPYETLKRFYKIYIRDFDGASELRDKLMHTKSTDEARALINQL